MGSLSLEQIISFLQKNLTSELFVHSAGVAETAANLARVLGADEDRARLAGWLHDCAREIVPQELLVLAETSQIVIDDFCRQQPVLLHAPVGAVVSGWLGVLDEAVLAAIRRHTLGDQDMSLLDRIVYVADKIELGRSYSEVEALRRKVAEDFHEGVLAVVAQTIRYLLAKKQVIHPLTISFWNSLLLSPLGSEANGTRLPLHR
ncbi:MAG: bis(5'-nucleosyl)-tetraphosphatase (symmetrical) YqeK [Dethiobacter sp.]|nr:bis(5'-nucleosyl)-tetraphosphatase (symmetrical) YqeK [Dethiobacter sp.]